MVFRTLPMIRRDKAEQRRNPVFNSIIAIINTIRFLLGAMNGLIAIGKCMISEVCGKEHETVGMSFVTGEQLRMSDRRLGVPTSSH